MTLHLFGETIEVPIVHSPYILQLELAQDNKEHCAMVYGDVSTTLTNPTTGLVEPVPVRVHSECFTGEVMGSLRCDCAEQLRKGLQYIAQQGRGVVVFLRQEGRGIGLRNKLR